jgi:hypothetical protein
MLLLLRIDADHRLTGIPVRFHLLVDVGELGVPIGMLDAFQCLGRSLQAEPVVAQQPAHGGSRDWMALPRQLFGQVTQRLGRPTQRGHRIAALVGFDQPEQGRGQLRIVLVDALAPTSAAACSPDRQRVLARLQFRDTPAHCCRADPGRLGHDADPAVPK